jgi:hypothetical protein
MKSVLTFFIAVVLLISSFTLNSCKKCSKERGGNANNTPISSNAGDTRTEKGDILDASNTPISSNAGDTRTEKGDILDANNTPISSNAEDSLQPAELTPLQAKAKAMQLGIEKARDEAKAQVAKAHAEVMKAINEKSKIDRKTARDKARIVKNAVLKAKDDAVNLFKSFAMANEDAINKVIVEDAILQEVLEFAEKAIFELLVLTNEAKQALFAANAAATCTSGEYDEDREYGVEDDDESGDDDDDDTVEDRVKCVLRIQNSEARQAREKAEKARDTAEKAQKAQKAVANSAEAVGSKIRARALAWQAQLEANRVKATVKRLMDNAKKIAYDVPEEEGLNNHIELADVAAAQAKVYAGV